jgi:BirA family transcriptional regulator, biotin operon repressor / biotin---[acetyl-CoA-carboxylase] ligase
MAGRARLDVPRLQAALAGIVAAFEVVDESPSTNAALLSHPSTPAPAVLVAEFQSAGRGRLDRTWVSPPRAGLTLSVLLRPTVPVSTWGWLPLLAGVALAGAVGTPARLKWPNDLLLGDRKAAGILVQANGDVVVVGIGVNVSTTQAELPSATATSIELGLDRPVDRTDLLLSLVTGVLAHYDAWSAVDGDAERSGLRQAYLEACATVGQPVVVSSVVPGDAEDLVGTATNVDSLGRLVLTGPFGTRAMSAGDVAHVRPAEA